MTHNARILVEASVILLSAALAGAQPVPPQPTGMVGPLNPVLFSQDGIPDGNGEVEGVLEFVNPTNAGEGLPQRTIQINFGNVICNGSSVFRIEGASSQSGQPFDEFGRAPGEVMLDGFDSSDPDHLRPTSTAFQEGGGAGVGSAAMLDADGNHAYEQLAIQGSNGGGPVAATLDVQSYDANGDDLPEFATLFDPAPADPLFNLGALQFFGLFCDSSPELYTTIWVPVGRDLAGDPAIIGDLDANGIADPEFYWGPKLQIRGSVVQVPTLSGLGLVALAVALLLAGLGLMRRRGFAAGL